MEHRTGFGYLVAAMAVVGIGWAASAQLGPLDPPMGPIADTSPSLAELEAKIDALGGGTGIPVGGWDSFFVSPGTDQLSTIELATGRVLLHKIVVHRAVVVAFDGPGQMSSTGVPLAGEPIGRAFMDFFAEDNVSKGQVTSIDHVFDTIAENGLHLAFDVKAGNASVQILYTQLDP